MRESASPDARPSSAVMESPRPQTKPITTPEKKKIPLGNHIAQHAIRANQGQQAFLQSRRVVLKQAGEILKRQIEIAKNVVDIQGDIILSRVGFLWLFHAPCPK